MLHYSKTIGQSTVTEHFSPNIIKGYPVGSFLILEVTDKPYVDLTDEERFEAEKNMFQQFIEACRNWTVE